MPRLTIVARITAHADQVALVRAALEQLIAPTRAEDGCLQYDLHQDNEHPGQFLFYEIWASREHWQLHMGSQHLRDFAAATAGDVADLALHELTQIG